MTDTHTPETEQAEAEHRHPSVGEYVEIGIILAVLTAIEVGLYYAGQAGTPRQLTIPSLVALTIMKFVLVVLWFMHLRFDHRLLRWLFIAGMLVAGVVYAAAIAMSLL